VNIADLRKEYLANSLHRRDLLPDPMAQFDQWLAAALESGEPEPTAMSLATVDSAGQPSLRIVLLKGVDARGLHFFTHLDSRKGRELRNNPRAAINLHWKRLERQVCVRGQVSLLPRQDAEAYFHSRPRGSRLAAWIGTQSAPVSGRSELEHRMKQWAARFPDDPVPMPDRWGGFMLEPITVEFWQGRSSRVHDRFQYTQQPDRSWTLERLSP
jgi:pyridoxamine 5'-phosphate oxidase